MSLSDKIPSIDVEDDGLYTPDVGAWARNKYRLLWCYADLFATSMKDKWDERVYVDIFSGAGYARIKNTNNIVLASPILAMCVNHAFDHYIFCDSDSKCIDALAIRVKARGKDANVRYIKGDANRSTDKILSEMPQFSKKHKVLTFCFIDPFKCANLHFETINKLSNLLIDFLILIPAMDPIRAANTYLSSKSDILDRFLGTDQWRDEWRKKQSQVDFDLFIAQLFNKQMQSLGYRYGGIGEIIRNIKKNSPLYRLGFFSRNKLGEKFWNEARKYSDPQYSLF